MYLGPDDLETPLPIFNTLNTVFSFTCDVAANDTNKKLDNYYSVESNALVQRWRGSVFMHPPITNQEQWLQKARIAMNNGCAVTSYIPFNLNQELYYKYFFLSNKIVIFPYCNIQDYNNLPYVIGVGGINFRLEKHQIALLNTIGTLHFCRSYYHA